MNRSAGDGKKEYENREGNNSQEGQRVWKEKVGQMEISGIAREEKEVVRAGNQRKEANLMMELAQQQQLLASLLSQLAQNMSTLGIGMSQTSAKAGGDMTNKGVGGAVVGHEVEKLKLGGIAEGNDRSMEE